MQGRESLRDDIVDVIATQDEIEAAVERLAAELRADLSDRSPIFVGVLTGAFVFMSDLVRRLDFPLEIDFLSCASYDGSTQSGELTLEMDMRCDVAGRHVVVVDDILDSGHTLSALVRMLQKREPESLRTCCLLDKPERREVQFDADYVGMCIPDRFVVGYGLDFAGHHRNLPFIGVLRPELYHNPQA